MPRAYSADLRERVITDREAGLGRAAAGRRYRVGERTVYRWLAEARHEGRRHAKPHAGGRQPVVAGTEESCTSWRRGRRRATPRSPSRPSCTRPAPAAG